MGLSCGLVEPVPEYQGRQRELEQLRQGLEQSGCCALVTVGRGGWGKTELLRKLCSELLAARSAAPRAPDGSAAGPRSGVAAKPGPPTSRAVLA